MTKEVDTTLAVAPCDFGWGSFGKLRLILEHLPEFQPVVVANNDVAETLNQVLGYDAPLPVQPEPTAKVALVINDPTAADSLSAKGLRVVYVDSLPYMWATASEVPRAVESYCAQRIDGGSPIAGGPLSHRTDIRWVDPIVPRPKRGTQRSSLVVNVGGLHSHLSSGADEAYLDLVLLPLATALAERHLLVSAVCGNIPARYATALSDILPDAEIGVVQGVAFETYIANAAGLISSPGSTTLLQAISSGTPLLLMPPQNLSQILNSRLLASFAEGAVQWPNPILDLEEVERLRPRGEDETLAYIYSRIRYAVNDSQWREIIGRSLGEALEDFGGGPWPRIFPPVWDGAAQVAAEVRRISFAA